MKKIKDMSPEEMRQYKQQLQARRAAEWEQKELQRRACEESFAASCRAVLEDAHALCDASNTPDHVRMVVTSLGKDARNVLKVFVASEGVDLDTARVLTGLTKRKVTDVYLALWECRIIWPDLWCYEFAEADYKDDGDLGIWGKVIRSCGDRTEALMVAVAEQYGVVLNQAAIELVKQVLQADKAYVELTQTSGGNLVPDGARECCRICGGDIVYRDGWQHEHNTAARLGHEAYPKGLGALAEEGDALNA